MTLQGSTNDFPLDVLLRLLADTKKTGELTIRGSNGDGALGLSEGQVVTAVFAQEKPIPALGAIFAIGEARFEFTPWDEAPTANLEGTLEENRKRADEHAKWLASVREVIPHDGIRFRLSERAADQGAVTFTPDRWRVVMAVNTQPDVNQLAANLHIDRDEALTTLAGLVRDGVLETVDAPPPDEAAKPAPGPPPTAEYFAPEPAPAAVEPTAEPSEDWSAALLKEAETEAAEAEAPEPAATPMPEHPQPQSAAPDAAQSTSAPGVDAWSTVSPAPQRPAPDTSPLPGPAPRDWSEIRVTPAPQPAERSAPMPQDWSQTRTTPAPEPTQQSSPMPQDWSQIRTTPAPESAAPSTPEPAMPDWGSPRQAERASITPAKDDRLAALDGMFTPPPPSSSAPASPDAWVAPAKDDRDAWTAPAPAAVDDWNAPAAPAASAAPAGSALEEDPRLAAMRLVPTEAPPAATPRPAPAPVAQSNEWAPPTDLDTGRAAAPAQAPKKGRFGGLFKKSEETAAQPATRLAAVERGGSSRVGQLAAFSNALLGEYNSGQYGKGHVDERISGLLMRVDEQADPIDRPLPIVDDRLDVQALERVAPPEQQAVPYLALLVTTIYGDAEKAFGRDKAKRGYKAAQQQVFGPDTSALNGLDLAGKLPRV